MKLLSGVLVIFMYFIISGLLAQEGQSYYEQMIPVEHGLPSHYPEPYDGPPVTNHQIADNFTVPEGEVWEITDVEIYGLTSMYLVSFDVFIYLHSQDPVDFPPQPTQISPPGEVLHHLPGLSYNSSGSSPTLYNIPFPDKLYLGTAQYFISFVATVTWDLNGPQDHTPFNWIVHAAETDATGVDGSYRSAYSPGGWIWQYDVDHDFTFRLNGRPLDAEIPLSNYAILLGIGLMLILAVIGIRRFHN